jgi:hypothetical protein
MAGQSKLESQAKASGQDLIFYAEVKRIPVVMTVRKERTRHHERRVTFWAGGESVARPIAK